MPFLNTCTLPVDGIADPTELRQTGRRGRPPLPVNVDQVEMLRGIGYTWDEVANVTLWRRLTEQNITLSRYLILILTRLFQGSSMISLMPV